LLVAIATLGVYRSATLHQSSWQGVSFGMFATYDNPASRIVRVTIDGDDRPYRAALPESLQDDATRLSVVPTERAAERLARSVLPLVVDDGATRVTVEVWRIDLRDRDGHLKLRLEPMVDGVALP
jgi:hypothetical protein